MSIADDTTPERPIDGIATPGFAAKPREGKTAVLGWVTLLSRLILGVVFLWAGIPKLMNIAQSVIAVRAYQFPIPPWMDVALGYGLPIVEALMGVVLIAGAFTRWAGVLAAGMLVAYIGAVASAWARGLAIDCGCFTPGGVLLDPDQKTKYAQDIVRDIGLLVCAGWLIVFPHSRWSLDSWLSTTDKDMNGIE